jgi:hypothetical protein
MDAKEKVHNRVIKVVFDFSLQPASVVPNVRAAARQQRITSAPSQPLVPVNEPANPQPVPSTETPEPVMPLSVPVAQEEEDTQTIVAPAMWQSPFHPLTPGSEPGQADPGNYDENQLAPTSPRHESFNIAAQYGNLPGFQPDLEKLGIPETPAINEAITDKEHFDVNEVNDVQADEDHFDVNEVNQVSEISDVNQVNDISNVNDVQADENHFDVMVQPEEVAPVESKDMEDQTAPPAAWSVIDPSLDTTDDYPWAQFLTPQPTSEESQAVPTTPSAVTGATEAEPSPTEAQAMPEKPVESQVGDDSQTVVVSTPRRTRTKRKTADLKTTGRQDTNGRTTQSSMEIAADPTVTNEPPQALQNIEEPSVVSEQSSDDLSTQAENPPES